MAINPMRLKQISGSQGFGDTVAHFTHLTGIDKIAEAYTRLTGRPCNCRERQAALNKLFPYKSK